MSARADAILESLEKAFRPDLLSFRDGENEVCVCSGASCGSLAGTGVADAFAHELTRRGINYDWRVVQTGCMGMCSSGPIVVVRPQGILYSCVTEGDVAEIVETTLVGAEVVERLLCEDLETGRTVAGLAEVSSDGVQQRLVLAASDEMDPSSIDDYLAHDGYVALAAVLSEDEADAVIDLVERSGLKGPDGGGALSGPRWRYARDAEGTEKYVICNAVDREPGAPVDRAVVASVPHRVVEGLAIAAFAVGASQAMMYVPSDDRLALERSRLAVRQARERGLLGPDVLGSGWSLDVSVVEGDDAVVCRDATALTAALQGHRAAPAVAPPYPAGPRLWDRPAVVETATTLAAAPWIVTNGPDAYVAAGSGATVGTRVVTLAGRLRRQGLVEVAPGTTLRQIVDDVGGGVDRGRPLKAVLVGGPLGSCLPATFLDLRVEAEDLRGVGVDPEFASIVAIDDTTCMVELARSLLAASQRESCGRCVPCRLGTRRMLEILERIVAGEGCEGDIELLEELAQHCAAGTHCGLGSGAADPVLSTLRLFRDEYEAHVRDKCCPAGSCAALVTFSIDAAACTGCGECVPMCPVGAIEGESGELHVIDIGGCKRCGTCREVCRFDAVRARAGIAPAVRSGG